MCVCVYMCVSVRPKKSPHFESFLLIQSSETEYSFLFAIRLVLISKQLYT